jgi:hypothetical protein
VAIAAIVISVLALLVATAVLYQATRANRLPAAVDLFREYRSPDMVQARRVLFQKLADENPNLGISHLPPDVRAAAERVGFYLDNVGALVAHRLVHRKLVAGFLGVSAQSQWKALLPYVNRERLNRDTVYLNYFEYLAAQMEKIEIEPGIRNLTPWVDDGRPRPRRWLRQPF